MKIESKNRLMRIKQVSQKLCIARSTIWHKVHHEIGFPIPFKLSPRVTVWDEAELDAYILVKKAAGQFHDRSSMVQ